MALYVQKLIPEARLPALTPEGSYTVFASSEVVIPSKGSAVVPLGIYLLAPAGHVIQAISGPESFNNSLEVGGYCSFNCPNPHFFKTSPPPQELRIKIYNHGEIDHTIRAGHPIGQIVIRQICPFQVLETEQIHEMIANPPAIPASTVKQRKLPKQAVTYFKQLYVTDYKTVKVKYLNEANLLKIEEYKKNPNYLSNPNKENLEAAFAWGLLDRTTQDQIRAELVVLNEQEARVDQMAGSRLKPVEEKETKKGTKKAAKPAAVKDDESGDAEPNSTDEMEDEVEETDADPDAGKKAAKPTQTNPKNIEDIEEIHEEEEETDAKAAAPTKKDTKKAAEVEEEDAEEEDEDEEAEDEEEDEEDIEEEEEEVVPKPAPKPAAPVIAAPVAVAPVIKAGAKKKAAAR